MKTVFAVCVSILFSLTCFAADSLMPKEAGPASPNGYPASLRNYAEVNAVAGKKD